MDKLCELDVKYIGYVVNHVVRSRVADRPLCVLQQHVPKNKTRDIASQRTKARQKSFGIIVSMRESVVHKIDLSFDPSANGADADRACRSDLGVGRR